jgi:hypothetical protein
VHRPAAIARSSGEPSDFVTARNRSVIDSKPLAVAATALLALALVSCDGREPMQQPPATEQATAMQSPSSATQSSHDSLSLALGALRSEQPQPRGGAAPAEPQSPELSAIPRITVEQLSAGLNAGRAHVIDVRDDEQYEAAHIAGSAHVRLRQIESQTDRLPKDKLIVLYCT